jgi:transcriptional regulator with XRE-family HTH domain
MEKLRGLLDRLGLKQAEFAELVDVSPRAVGFWVAGTTAIPGPVSAYLRMLLTAGPDVLAAEYARLKRRERRLDEGLYGLRYHAPDQVSDATGDGLAVLCAGKIIGTDRWGGIFNGRYDFDPIRQLNTLQVNVRVPPHGHLITGLVAGETGSAVTITAKLKRPNPAASAIADVYGQPVEVTLTYLGPLPN